MSKRLFTRARTFQPGLIIAVTLVGSLVWLSSMLFRGPGPGAITSAPSASTSQTAMPELKGAQARQLFKQTNPDQSLRKALAAARFGLERQEQSPFDKDKGGPGYLGTSHEQNLNAWFDKDSVTVTPTLSEKERESTWRMGMRLRAYGYGEQLEAAPPVLSQQVKDNRIEYVRGYAPVTMPEINLEIPGLEYQAADRLASKARARLTEWYVNSGSGIEQGFTFDTRPERGERVAADAVLRLALSVTGDLRARLKDEGQAIQLLNGNGEVVLGYNKLVAWDSTGKRLAARMQTNDAGDEIALEVDEREATYPITIDPILVWEHETRLFAQDGATGDIFGAVIDLGGGTLIVGAPYDDVGGKKDQGSAYVFVRKGEEWVLQKHLFAADGGENDQFGSAVAISHNTVVIGARSDDVNHTGGTANEGSAYVFVRNGSRWTQQQRLVASNHHLFAQFGYSVAISGDTIVVGALLQDAIYKPGGLVSSFKAGAAYVFERRGAQWSQKQILENTTDGANAGLFGASVAIDENTILVGTPQDWKEPCKDKFCTNLVRPGSVYVYERDAAGWTRRQRLLAPDGAENDQFGISVAISGGYAIIGACLDDNGPSSPDQGSAYIFNDVGTWDARKKLVAENGMAGDRFGFEVDIEGETAVIGADGRDADILEDAGAAYVFNRIAGVGWQQFQQLNSNNDGAGDRFGISVAISGGTLAVGAHYGDAQVVNQGTVHTFRGADKDGDSLLDEWEKHGITIDAEDLVSIGNTGNGEFIDLPAMGANPLHKDIFVHVDWMLTGPDGFDLAPDPRALQNVIDAFLTAPVDNPDGKQGITLHIDAGNDSIMDPLKIVTWGEKGLSLAGGYFNFRETVGAFDSGKKLYDWSEFDALKKRSPFTTSRRASVFHYAMFVNKLPDEASGKDRGNPSADFIIAKGEIGANLIQEAITFMHELGHNLGLDHGGGEDIQRKPNYLSIMNYWFINSNGLMLGPDGKKRKLDFSREELPRLDEKHLNELVGISDLQKHVTLWSIRTAPDLPPGRNQCAAHVDDFQKFFLPSAALDWNCDKVRTATEVVADLNGDGQCVGQGTDGTLETTPCNGYNNPDPSKPCDDERRIERIVAGADRRCDTTALGSDTQSQPPGFEQPDLLFGYNDWKNLSFAGDGKIGNAALTREPGPAFTESDELPYKEILADSSPAFLNEGKNAPLDEVTLSTRSGIAPLTVNFDGSASRAITGNIVDWAWDFGDGTIGTGAQVSHTYTRAGDYYASLTVTDSSGRVNLISLLHRVVVIPTVIPAPTPPPDPTPEPTPTPQPTPVLPVGEVDYGFNPTVTRNYVSVIYAITPQPDGKILVGGDFESFAGCARQSIARVNANGTCDPTFDPGLGLTALLQDSAGNTVRGRGHVRAIVVQPDGKILVGLMSANVKVVVRLNSDGTVDSSFNAPVINRQAVSGVFSIALQDDGRIIIGGAFSINNGVSNISLARLNADGSVDTSFTAQVNGAVNALAVQSDGKIIIGGFFSFPRQGIARLNPDGSVDPDFNVVDPTTGEHASGFGGFSYVNALGLQPDGKIAVGGLLHKNGGQPNIPFARLMPDGSRDESFTNGLGFEQGHGLALQTDGKIVVIGHFRITSPVLRNYIARLNPDGQVDTSYDTGTGTQQPPGQQGLRELHAVALKSNGKAIIGGQFDFYNDVPADSILQLNLDGTRDLSFGSNGSGLNGEVFKLVRQPDGKLLVGFMPGGGNTATRLNGARRGGIGRLNANGSLDPTFTSPFHNEAFVEAVALQSDGRVVVAGSFKLIGSSTEQNVARLNTDGTLDTTFNVTFGSGAVRALAIQPDGKILAGGSFDTVNNESHQGIVRFNPDGTIDQSFVAFAIGVGIILVEPDGRILVAGGFAGINRNPRKNIARLNVNGSLDESFNTINGPDGAVMALARQADGRIVIGGSFFNCNDTPRDQIARLNSDGTLDTSFIPVNASQRFVRALALNSEGKIFVGGTGVSFFHHTSPSTAPPNNVFRLNADGTLDNTLPLGTGIGDNSFIFDSTVNTISVQPDDNIVIGGRFDVVDDAAHQSLARIATAINSSPTINLNTPPTIDQINNLALNESASSQTINLSGISSGGDEAQRVTVTSRSNNTLLIPNPSINYTNPNSTGSLSFTPVAGASGSANITVTVKDNGGTVYGGVDTITRTFTVTVTGVNEVPTLNGINNLSVAEDAPPQTVNLSGITAGPAGENTQTLTVTAASSNSGLIPNPAVTYTSPNATGSLIFTPVANASGSALISVMVKDNGGTANGGVDTFTRTFTVTVTAVNDPPSFIKGPDQTVNEDTGAQAISSWAKSISAGPADETAQSLTFTATNNNNSLFSVQPSISAAGALSYTPAANQSGTATVSVTLKDNGGTANGGQDTSATQTFTITVNGVNDAPVNTVPGSQTIMSNTTMTFSSANGGIISISDDAGALPVEVTLVATGGTISLSPVVGLSFITGDGTADPTMTFNGTISSINAALNGLVFTPTANFAGAASVQITTNDQGHTGSGGSLTDTDKINITVNAPASILQFESVSYSANEADNYLLIKVTRSGDKSAPATIKYSTSDSTDVNFRCDPTTTGQPTVVASRKCDYHIASGRLRFASGEETKQFALSLVNDTYVEGAETFTISLSDPTGATLGQNVNVTVTILDDDLATGAANPVDDTRFYVRQLYVDLLSREPEPIKWDEWVTLIDECGQTGQASPPCDRVTVGGDGFLRSGEFFDRQFFVLRLYRTGLGRILYYDEVGDLAFVSGFLTGEHLELNKQDLVAEIVARPEFSNRYNGLNDTLFVDTLLQTAGVTVPADVRLAWITALGGAKTRAQVFREISERQEVSAKYLHEAQVVSAYYGFFTRNPDAAYLNFIRRLDSGEITLGDLAHAFINSAEYRQRFNPQ